MSTFEGKTPEEAIALGLKTLDLEEEEVEITILDEGKKGFLGFGRKEAKVELKPKNSPLTQDEDYLKTDEASNDDLDDESLEDVTPFEEVKKEEKVVEEEDSFQESLQTIEDVGHYLIDVLHAYLVDVDIEIEDMGEDLIFHIETDKPGLVIGKHGKIINALETLAQVTVNHHIRRHAQVEVNVGSYRERRQETLTRLAQHLGEKVAYTGKKEVMEPLPSRERKIIHQALSHYPYLKTYSEGRGSHRHVVVTYQKEEN